MSVDPFNNPDAFDGTHPDSWEPQVGDYLIGKLQYYDRVTTQDGPCTLAIVLDEKSGAELTVWIGPFALRSRFEAQQPKPGERIFIKRLPDKRSRSSGRDYKDFAVRVQRDASAEGAMPSFGSVPDEDAQRREQGLPQRQPMPQTQAVGPGSPQAEEPPWPEDVF